MVKSLFHIITVVCISMLVMACNSSPKKTKLELMSYGLPIAIAAPEGAEVIVEDMGIMKDLTVKKGDEYYVQILSFRASSNNINKLKSESLAEVKGGRFFSKIIQEDEAGFIFEKKIDENINYDFRYFKIQGDSEYSFQTGLIGTFTEEQVRDMYTSVM